MPDPTKQKKKNKLKPEYRKDGKRGSRRSDGSIVGGIAGPNNPKPRKSNLGKKSDSDTPEMEAQRIKEYKEAKAAKEAENARASAKARASAGTPTKNLGTVSDGTPFYKSGPLYAHEAGHIDPTKEAKAKAEAKAKKNHDASSKVYGETTKTQTTKDGVTTYTISRPWTKKGSGSGGRNLGPGYKPSKAETARANAARKSSGVDTRSHTSFNLKPVGIKFTPMLPTADIIIPKVPKKSKPPMPTFSMSKGRSGGGTTKLIDFNNNRVKKQKAGSGNSCGCT